MKFDSYEEFLKSKELQTIEAGFDVPDEWLSDKGYVNFPVF